MMASKAAVAKMLFITGMVMALTGLTGAVFYMVKAEQVQPEGSPPHAPTSSEDWKQRLDWFEAHKVAAEHRAKAATYNFFLALGAATVATASLLMRRSEGSEGASPRLI